VADDLDLPGDDEVEPVAWLSFGEHGVPGGKSTGYNRWVRAATAAASSPLKMAAAASTFAPATSTPAHLVHHRPAPALLPCNRSAWRGLYRRLGDVFVIGAIGLEAQGDKRGFGRTVAAAQVRLDLIQSPATRAEWDRTALARAVAHQVVRSKVEYGLSQTAPGSVRSGRPCVARLERGDKLPALSTLVVSPNASISSFHIDERESVHLRVPPLACSDGVRFHRRCISASVFALSLR